MAAFSMASFAGTSLALLIVGLRLLWIARRTRQIPELSIGLAYTLGIVGLAIQIAVVPMGRAGADVYAAWVLGMVTMAAGGGALVVGVWRTFQPTARWARFVAAGALGLGVASVVALLIPGEVPSYTEMTPQLWLVNAFWLFAYAWVAIESLCYWDRLKRRRALGLADPLMVQRFLLWGISGTCAGFVSIIAIYTHIVLHLSFPRVPVAFLITQALLIVSSAGTWFAFFPPRFYQRWANAAVRSP